MISDIQETTKRKHHAIIVTAEGAHCNADELSRYFLNNRELSGFELRTTVLGYVQRGATPNLFDRILATRLGVAAVEAVAQKNYGVLVGMHKSEIITTPLETVVSRKKELDLQLLKTAEILSK